MRTQTPIARRIVWLVVSAWIVAFSAGASAAGNAAAGKVVFAAGQVQVERGGKTLPLAKDAEIESGDTIVTGADGRVQLIMADGDRMALRTNTRFRVDEFKRPSSAEVPETGRSFYNLLKGGFRAVTRSLGRRGLDSYQVRTQAATIGIRGTTYWVIQWPGDAKSPAGIYFGVSDGSISVGNNTGQKDFKAGQYGYVKDLNTPPQLLSGPPAFLQGEGGAGGGTGDGAGGYKGGAPLRGCADTAEGDFNCPPVQPLGGDGVDLTPGQRPPVVQPPDDCVECSF